MATIRVAAGPEHNAACAASRGLYAYRVRYHRRPARVLSQGDDFLNQIHVRAASSRVRSWRAQVAAGVMSAVLAACGGGGGSSPPPAVTIQSSATSTTPSGAAVTLTAALSNSASTATPTWSLSGPGSLSATSGSSITYTPPDSEDDANDGGVSAVVTVSVGSLSQTQTIQVAAKAFPGHHWSLASLPSSSWQVVSYANGLFVAGASDGVLATSPDGTTWTRHDTNGNEEWISAVYSATGGWLLLDDMNNTLLGSKDGAAWAPVAMPAAAAGDIISRIIYDNGIYVMLGYSGGSVASTDGATWTKSSVTGLSIASGNGLFVVANTDGQLVWSADGVTWTVATQPSGLDIETVGFHNGHFVATSGTQVLGSSDGKTFTAVGTSPYSLDDSYPFVSIAGTLYVPSYQLYASADDVAWNIVTPAVDGVTSMAASSTTVVAVSSSGAIAAGADVAHLAVVKAGQEGTLGSALYADGRYLWTSGKGLWSSTDGKAWVQTDFAPGSGQSFMHGNGIAVAPDGTIVISGELDLADGTPVTNAAAFAWSADGVSWNFVKPQGATGNDFDAGPIVHDGARFLSIGARTGFIHASADGHTWTTLGKITLPSGIGIAGLAYANGHYVVVGSNGYAATSTDGVTWTAAAKVTLPGSTTSALNMSGLVYAAGKFVAVGANAVAATSTDGLTWTSLATPAPTPANVDTSIYLNAIAVSASGEIVAVGNNGLIETSLDGVHWTVRTTGRTETLTSVAVTPTGFMTGGDYDMVLLSTN